MADRYIIVHRPKVVQPQPIKPFYDDEREAIAALEYARRDAADPSEIVLVKMQDMDKETREVAISDVDR